MLNLSIRKTKTLTTAIILFAVCGNSMQVKSEPLNEKPFLQSTSPVPAQDQRVAALWEIIPSKNENNPQFIKRRCSTGSLGNNWWITAQHCLAHNPQFSGFIMQNNKQIAGIGRIYTLSEKDDIALIRTGSGLEDPAFELPKRSLSINEQATLIGFGATHSFPSAAKTRITQRVPVLEFDSEVYTQLLQARSITVSRSCNEDSGAPVFIGNTIYAVHTAGGYNPTCTPGKNKLMWHTDIFPRSQWIRETIAHNPQLSAEEVKKAETSKEIALKYSGPFPTSEAVRPVESSSIFSLSSR